jgi:hypothetical protein
MLLFIPACVVAQSSSTVSEYDTTLTTYPFSQPNPVANSTNIYPYFRFDGFTDNPIQKKWKVVELENDFIKVFIMPQIGGKIWTAVDKKNGEPFIYDNDAVKFRDIAMRGPWTSGGIEINYGIFGHTPGVSTPVNYVTRENPDGSASCILSLFDMLTGTRWSLEVRLPKDKAYFVTKSFWHNGTGIYQPYYTWMNMAQKVRDSLEYIFPGNHYIFHDGKRYSWPIDKKNGKNISIYNQNNFGGSKSYHVTGIYSKYFGAYWKEENFGMIHYALRQDKIGKKIFIWGLSRQGKIWKDILTDHAGQYTEMQSGRLYNQNAPPSVLTPFKQFHFMPYNTDTWSEYWYPFKNTGGVASADLNGVFNLKRKGGDVTLFISPVSYINDTLKVRDTDGKLIYHNSVHLKPLQSFQQTISLNNSEEIGKIILGESIVNLQDSSAKTLDRPLKPDSDFDWNSAYGLYLKGRYASGTRHYKEAEKGIRASLDKESFFMPSLTEMAYLQYRKMNYDSSFYYARKALSIDTYAPAANYYYGLAALKLNKRYDALDGFQIAVITPKFRSAAYTELSKMQIRKQHYKKAYKLAAKSLVYNSKNITSLQLQYLASRLMGHTDAIKDIKKHVLKLDPLNNFIRFENYWQQKTKHSKKEFTDLIRDELPQQTYLNLAIWYYHLGRKEESKKILEICPEKNDEILYWLAYLNKDNADANKWLNKADTGDPHFVFPYRNESATVMQWAVRYTQNWKPRYYLALIVNFHNHKRKALNLLESIKKQINFAPLYVTRARLRDSTNTAAILKDYKTAASVNKKDWRYGKYLSEYLLTLNKKKRALKVIAPYYKKDTDNYITGMLYARCLMLNDQYKDAEKVLGSIHILPYEGAKNGHKLYKQIKLMLALQLLKHRNYQKALKKVDESRQWPEHLGVGKPYPNMINDRLQNEIENLIRKAEKKHKLNKKQINSYVSKVKAINK